MRSHYPVLSHVTVAHTHSWHLIQWRDIPESRQQLLNGVLSTFLVPSHILKKDTWANCTIWQVFKSLYHLIIKFLGEIAAGQVAYWTFYLGREAERIGHAYILFPHATVIPIYRIWQNQCRKLWGSCFPLADREHQMTFREMADTKKVSGYIQMLFKLTCTNPGLCVYFPLIQLPIMFECRHMAWLDLAPSPWILGS